MLQSKELGTQPKRSSEYNSLYEWSTYMIILTIPYSIKWKKTNNIHIHHKHKN